MAIPMLIKIGIAAVALYALVFFLSPKKKTTSLPPGPKPFPLVGNIADLPPPGVKEWEHWLKHKDLYGTCCPQQRTLGIALTLFLRPS